MTSGGAPALRLPDFLLIGAMKAGTTTLYRDLLLNGRVFFPIDKEPGHLASDAVLDGPGRTHYGHLYHNARPNQLCGDASTTYTKLPDVTGVPARTERVFGKDVKLIYIVRNPVDRAASHYRHMVAHAGLTGGFEDAIERVPGILAYSRYAYQLQPWLERFGSGRILVVKFEEYVRERRRTVRAVCRFLGVPPELDGIDERRVFNGAGNTRVVRGGWRRIRDARLYRTLIRQRLSVERRERLRTLLLPRAQVEDPLGNPNLRARLADVLRTDMEEFADMLAWREPIW